MWWPFWKWRPVEIFRSRESIQDVEIEQCWICVVLWQPFWKWQPVEIIQCQESIRDIIIYPHMKCRWNWTMLNLCGIVVAILKMATARNFPMSGINLGCYYLPTYQILMISDNVEFLQPIFYAVFLQPFWKWQTSWKWRPVEIIQCWESIQDIIIYPHIKFWWYRTMLNFCDHFVNGDRWKFFNVGNKFETS